MTQKFLADVNFWLAIAIGAHANHASAAHWFSSQGDDSVGYCRMTQQGFLRLLTDVRVFKTDAVTLPESWAIFDSLMDDPRVYFLRSEPAGLDDQWKVYTQRPSFSPKVWNDAYLAAFAKTGNFELVTFDRGFVQYEGLRVTILS